MGKLKEAFYIDGSKAIFRNWSFLTWMVIAAILAFPAYALQIEPNFFPDLFWGGVASLPELIVRYLSNALAALPIYLGLYIAIHRSMSMELKNDFDRRFKHEEEFDRHISKYVQPPFRYNGEQKEADKLLRICFSNDFHHYRMFFPENVNSAESFSVTQKWQKQIYSRLADFTLIELVTMKSVVSGSGATLAGVTAHEKTAPINLAINLYRFFGIEILVGDQPLRYMELMPNGKRGGADAVQGLFQMSKFALEYALSFMSEERTISDSYIAQENISISETAVEYRALAGKLKRENNSLHK